MIVAVSMMRDEADVAAAVVEHLYAEGVDRIIVADNLSTDGTGEILRDCGVEVMCDPEPAYYQAEKMTALAHRAATEGATWVLPFDADEVWYSPDGPIGDILPDCGADVLYAHGWDHIVTLDDEPGHPFHSIRRRRQFHQPLPKVAFRAHPDARIAQGNHDVYVPGAVSRGGILEYRHFQWRSFDQFARKARNGKAAYDLTNLSPDVGAHWRLYGSMTDDELGEVWNSLCSEPFLVDDPAPVKP